MGRPIFISHARAHDDFVKKLRETLELHSSLTWVDSRTLSGGDDLKTIIKQNIRNARHVPVLVPVLVLVLLLVPVLVLVLLLVLLLVSLAALGSEWVQRKVRIALDQNALEILRSETLYESSNIP